MIVICCFNYGKIILYERDFYYFHCLATVVDCHDSARINEGDKYYAV